METNTKPQKRAGQDVFSKSPGTGSEGIGHCRRQRLGKALDSWFASQLFGRTQSSSSPPHLPQPMQRRGQWRDIRCWREILHLQEWQRPTHFTVGHCTHHQNKAQTRAIGSIISPAALEKSLLQDRTVEGSLRKRSGTR